MKDFEYKYKQYPYRIKPFGHLVSSETSFIIYRAYKTNMLNSSDVKSFIYKNILKTLTALTIPVLCYKMSGKLLK